MNSAYPPIADPSLSGPLVMVVSYQLQHRFSNLAASRMLRDGHCFILRDMVVEATQPWSENLIKTLVAKANDEGYRTTFCCHNVRDLEGRDPAKLWVVSSRHLNGGGKAEGVILITARCLQLMAPISGREAMEMLGLTAAEARLAVRLASGLGLADIAGDQGVNVSTLRAQLRSIFAKTGTSRQAELVAHVWRASTL